MPNPAGSEGGFPGPVPAVPLQACPVRASLGTLGRKWTLSILRDIAFEPGSSFTAILRSNPGLRQRTLSLRLRQLTSDGLVARSAPATGRRRANYTLTEKGREVWPILAGLLQFGVRNYAATVFADGQPREIEEVFPDSAALMIGPLTNFARSATAPRPTSSSGRAAASPRRPSRARPG